MLNEEEVMARSDTRYSVYPAPKAIEILGSTAPALNQAIQCWASLLARATADNAKTFYWNEEGCLVGHLTGKREDMHALHPWGVLAEALKDVRFDPEFANPGELLATAVEDAHRMEDAAEKWFSSEFDGEEYAHGLETTVKELIRELRNLDYAHAWAVIVAVQWFWDHHGEGIDIKKDAWWTLAFRRQWHKKRSGSKQGAITADQQTRGKRGNKKPPSKQ
jgi:hypothetical protein